MISIAIISPASHLEKYSSLGDIEMALTHMIIPEFDHNKIVTENYNKYYSARSAEGKWVILDNSAYEIGNLQSESATGEGLKPDLVLKAGDD